MDAVIDAVEQDAIAESLLGEPEQTEQVEAGTEAQEVQGQEQLAEGEQLDEQPEEGAEDWFPTEQDKTFTDEALLKYAQRYQKDAEWLSDPLNRQLLTDKLNTDIFLRQQQEQWNQQQEFVEPEPEPTQQPQTLPTFDEYMKQLEDRASAYTDPNMASRFANGFLQAFGVKEQATPEVAQALSKTMTTFGVNLMRTVLQNELLPMLDQVAPGFSGMYYTSARAGAWDQVRNSDARYAELPAYGSKEMIQLCEQVASQNPGLTGLGQQLEAANGGQLYGPKAVQFYRTLADLALRPQADPNLLAQAAQAGARNARRGEVRRQAGNLGAGRSTSGTQRPAPSSKFQTNTDIFDDETMANLERYGRG